MRPHSGGVRPNILRWPATNRSAAGGSGGDQEVFDTDGVLLIKPALRRWWPALRCAPWMMRLNWM